MSSQTDSSRPRTSNQLREIGGADRPTVLLYDDDQMYLNLLAKIAKRENLQVRKCSTLRDFTIEVIKGKFDLAIVDYWLEDKTNGCMVAKITQKPVLLITSNPDTVHDRAAIPDSIIGFMDKSEGPSKILKYAFQMIREQKRKGAHTMDYKKQKKYILIDDDSVFSAIMQRCAEQQGIALDVYESVEGMGYVGLLGKYDGAIVDYDLGTMTGVEIGEYLASFFDDIPMILISAKDRSSTSTSWPSCVRKFLTKEKGYSHIIEEAVREFE